MSRVKAPLLAAVSAIMLAGCAANSHDLGSVAHDGAAAGTTDSLAEGFASPPMDARPRTWWHWMNGNVTKDGIAKDLAWMASVGLGGVQSFDAALDTPQIVDERLVYMTPGWKDAFRFAASEAERLGLELTIAASPGWSETGGPWVRPEQGMKKLVWAEEVVPGGKRFAGLVPTAPTITGPFQTAAFRDEMMASAPDGTALGAHGRVAVVAVPVASAGLPAPVVRVGTGVPLDSAVLGDNDLETSARVPLDKAHAGEVQASFPKAVTVRAFQVYFPGLKLPFRGVPISPVLEARVGGQWQKVTDVPLSAVPTTVSFAAVTAREFRLRIEAAPPADMSELKGAPGALEIDIFALGDMSTIALADMRFFSENRVDRVEEKAGFQTVLDYHAITSADRGSSGIAPVASVIDLTDKVGAGGQLDWTPPAGHDWRIFTFGWSLTGKVNHPAPKEATGLEVDKFDAAAVREYLQTYLAMYRGTGAQGIDALLTDSIEVGLSNWTPRMEAEFEARRGYALRPWLPALAGIVIGSRAETDGFLSDWRQTLADLLAESHYGTVAAVARENGLKVYGEALEDRRPLLGDDLAMRSHADVPMAALWSWQRDGQVRSTLIGDMKGAASVAHVYGKPFVAAESMTAANSPWAFAPRDLRRIIDLEFVSGINRPVIHTSVHQPSDDKQPGLSLLIFGQYFNRHETWAGMARPWVDYMARSAYLLQQGTYFADVAVFKGEEAPVTAQFAAGQPAELPRRYAYDFVNAAMLAEALRVEDGMLVSRGGTRYRVLQLGASSRLMTLKTLRRVGELARQGATIVGQRPQGSPSRADNQAEFDALAQAIWARANVIAAVDVEVALAGLGQVPDFAIADAAPDSEILFLHRSLADGGQLYFLTNRNTRAEKVEARFRVTGLQPEWWDAVTGTARPLSYRTEGGVTVVPLEMGPEGSGFVVWRKPATAATVTVAPIADKVMTTIDGPWTVTFQAGRGAPDQLLMDHLAPLNEHADPAVRYFSGVATYATDFTNNGAGPLWLDLGQIGDVAEVLVNGQSAGITWWNPERVEIGRFVKPGSNRLEVKVANVWVNRLIGDQQPGGQRVTFTAAPTYRPDAPLRPAGLIGPVRTIITN